MSVVSCKRALGEYSSMPIPGLDTEFEDAWNITTDSINDNAATIYASGLLPARFTPFPDNIFATVRRIGLHRERNNPLVWRAQVHYSSVPLTQQEVQRALHDNPIERDAEIDWDSSPYQSPVTVSVDDLNILNSAGDVPDPVPEKTDFFWLVTVVKNVLAIPSWAIDYAGKTNSDPFTLDDTPIAVDCARLVTFRLSRKMREGDYTYRQLTMGFELRAPRDPRYEGEDVPPPFHLELPDIGLNERKPGSDKLTRIMTDDVPPRQVSLPVPLNGLGQKMTNPTLENIHLRRWRIYGQRPFSTLPLT